MLFDPKWNQQATQFKTAKELRLNKAQYNALLRVLAYLEDGKIAWLPDWKREISAPLLEGLVGNKLLFSMHDWTMAYVHCGTVCCIGGLAEVLSGHGHRTLFPDLHDDHPLSHVFFPKTPEGWKAGPQQAAKVLREWLTTGRRPTDW